MATVTGYTAERMKQIEDTTVVDGEVQGDKLILLQRNGTPIDAGNVRGPQGAPGPSGTIGSVNDQAQSAVYAPRIFATKAALDSGWAAAPIGAYAVTTDTESLWQKNSSGWLVVNSSRIFTTSADLNARWPNPPEGAIATTIDADAEWYRSQSGWDMSNPVRVFSTAAERDSHWPSPPRGAMCVTIDTHTTWLRTTNGWQPPPGTLVYSNQTQIPDIATGNIWPGWAADIYRWPTPVTFPYPTRVQSLVGFSAGYGADWISWHSQIVPLLGGGSPYVYGSAGQAVWSSSSLLYNYDAPANTDIGWKHWFVADAMGGNSTNVHTGGIAAVQVFSRV